MSFRACLPVWQKGAEAACQLPALDGAGVFSLAIVPTSLPSLILVTSLAPGGI